jgi:hypothetical protein
LSWSRWQNRFLEARSRLRIGLRRPTKGVSGASDALRRALPFVIASSNSQSHGSRQEDQNSYSSRAICRATLLILMV